MIFLFPTRRVNVLVYYVGGFKILAWILNQVQDDTAVIPDLIRNLFFNDVLPLALLPSPQSGKLTST